MDPSQNRPHFKDHFSGHAEQYEAFRPTYPDALYDALAALAPGDGLAWDCATGNGQAAVALAARFGRVVATDASLRQLAKAKRHEKVAYVVATAERTPIAAGTVDLTTVALALHWFDLPRFYAEVRRVSRPGGIVAAWTYTLPIVDPAVDAVIHRLYAEVLGPYWTPEIRHIESGYRTLPFPFEEAAMPEYTLSRRWDMTRLLDFTATWSGWQRFCTETGEDPRRHILNDLAAAWGDPADMREVVWRLLLRVGRVVDR